jgi:Flp pilus assembly protein TadB
MKKMLIGALVGAIILFIWQFLSWSITGIHESQMQYTENQDAIMEVLSENLQEGSYFLPTVPKDASPEDSKAFMDEQIGKPWATVSYYEAYTNNMGMNMFRGFAVDFLAALLLCWILLQFANLTFSKTVLASLAVGFIGYFTVNYLNSIWFEGNTLPDLIDVIVSWGVTGVWLGWWLNR